MQAALKASENISTSNINNSKEIYFGFLVWRDYLEKYIFKNSQIYIYSILAA